MGSGLVELFRKTQDGHLARSFGAANGVNNPTTGQGKSNCRAVQFYTDAPSYLFERCWTEKVDSESTGVIAHALSAEERNTEFGMENATTRVATGTRV